SSDVCSSDLQGIANIVSPLFGGIAATGAIARTATNIRNGGNAPIAGVVHALALVLILLVVAPWAGKVPLAALAAILFVVSWNMSEAPRFVRMVRKAPRADAAILLITFALTILTDLVVAVNIGVILAMLVFMRRMIESLRFVRMVRKAPRADAAVLLLTCDLTTLTDLVVAVNIGVILAMLVFMRRMSASVAVVEQTQSSLRQELEEAGLEAMPRDVLVYSIDGPFFFGSVDSLERALAWSRTPPRYLALRLERVPFIDATGLKRLESTIAHLRRQGVDVLLNGANMAVL